MYYLHNNSQVLYKFIQKALLQDDNGVWVDCVIYENVEGMIFVRKFTDWEKSFTKVIK